MWKPNSDENYVVDTYTAGDRSYFCPVGFSANLWKVVKNNFYAFYKLKNTQVSDNSPRDDFNLNVSSKTIFFNNFFTHGALAIKLM